MKKSIAIFLITSLFCINGFSQKIHPFMKTKISVTSVEDEGFISTEAGFSVPLPKEIRGYIGTKGILYNWRLIEGFYYVGSENRTAVIENAAEYPEETLGIIEELFKSVARDLFATKTAIISSDSRFVYYDGHKAVELRTVLTDTVFIARVFWVKNKAYKMAVLLSDEQKQFEPNAKKIFDAFKVLSQESSDEIIRKKVEEATPQPLPQNPRVPKAKSDAEDRGLKGKVKIVLEESKYVKGTKADNPKQKDSEDFFNEDGNWIKRISYDTRGLPFQIRVYGYIDGSRVEKTGSIHYESQFPAPMMPQSPNPPKRDFRYSMKFDYKYDDKERLKEEIVYSNDGTIWTKSVFKYIENTVEEIRYQDNNKNSSKSIKTYDLKGNEIEAVYFGLNSDEWKEKLIYKYSEFDKNGNWTKRLQQFFRNTNGVENQEWVEENYRTITYYE
jgi:hypothetical protein